MVFILIFVLLDSCELTPHSASVDTQIMSNMNRSLKRTDKDNTTAKRVMVGHKLDDKLLPPQRSEYPIYDPSSDQAIISKMPPPGAAFVSESEI